MPPSSASGEQDGASQVPLMAFSSPSSDSSPQELAQESAQVPAQQPTQQLLEQLRDDRQWLLRQLDAGSWPEYRLDLAALERELGQLLDQAQERLGS